MSGRFEKHGRVLLILVDNPPVNAISVKVREHIVEGVRQLAGDPGYSAAILACAGRSFMVGADIKEFKHPPSPPILRAVIDAIESSLKPIVAAIHGSALGGGMEVALGCHYRIASRDARFGLPEVKLGILPGAGGTQRLPRLMGIEASLEMILTGNAIFAPRALDTRLIDRIAEKDLLPEALAFAASLTTDGAPWPRVRDRTFTADQIPTTYFADARQRLTRERKELFAPRRIVDALEAAATMSFDEGMQREAELVAQCKASSQASALQHVFFAERQTSKVPDLDDSVPVRPVGSMGVVGAGTMGRGIAMAFANAGFPVQIFDKSAELLERALDAIRQQYRSSAAKGRLTLPDMEARLALLTLAREYRDLSAADLLVEAVFETMAVKREIFAQLDAVAKPEAILATNTSYLSIDDVAASTTRPGSVVGLHFFAPANVMRLVEIVRGAQTSPQVLRTAIEAVKNINKIGVVCRNQDGFIGNRMLRGYSYQAYLMALEGAAPQQIDDALRAFGLAMGVFEMNDLAGLDVSYKSRKDRDPSSFDGRVTRTADLLVEMGRLGQKSLAGYYDYVEGDRTPRESSVTEELLARVSKDYGIRRRTFTDEEIVERCMLGLVNAGCEVLREGVAYRASDIDIVYINGYGFPAYRGGPMFWAENEFGLPKAYQHLQKYAAEQAGWLKVSPLLETLATQGLSLISGGAPSVHGQHSPLN